MSGHLPLLPVMAFIDTADIILGVEINQIDARYIVVGQPIELTFSWSLGTVRPSSVDNVSRLSR